MLDMADTCQQEASDCILWLRAQLVRAQLNTQDVVRTSSPITARRLRSRDTLVLMLLDVEEVNASSEAAVVSLLGAVASGPHAQSDAAPE